MVNVDAQHTGEPEFESLLRHFFKNLTQPLALPESPAGQTVCHPPLSVHKPVDEPFVNRWTIRKVVHPCWTIRLVDNPQVGKTTMNPLYFDIPCHVYCFHSDKRPISDSIFTIDTLRYN